MRSRLLLAIVACAALAFVAAGCGDDDAETTAAAEWAEEFCTATRTWGDEIQRIGGDLTDVASQSAETVSGAADEVRAATDTYLETVRALGRPDTDSGQEVEDSVAELSDEVAAESAEIEDAIDDLTGITGVVTAAREITASASAMFTALERTLEAIESADAGGELEAALDEADACGAIGR
jgi:ABC-type transporter Mla subunit MlaD